MTGHDLVALGEVMLRLDPGEGRVRTARSFRVWEGDAGPPSHSVPPHLVAKAAASIVEGIDSSSRAICSPRAREKGGGGSRSRDAEACSRQRLVRRLEPCLRSIEDTANH